MNMGDKINEFRAAGIGIGISDHYFCGD